MRISVIHPSRNRPKEAFATACKWRDNADLEFEYILCLDNDDKAIDDYLKLFDAFSNKAIGCTFDNKSAIEAINHGAKISCEDILITISDDFDCPQHWDTILLEAIGNKTDFCAKTNDGLQNTLITMPIMDRIYYERYGYIYNPEYRHMFVDQELTAVAIMTGKYLKFDILFKHLHYTTGQTKRDAINVKNDLTWNQGQTLFNERLKTNFGIENPIIPYSEIKWH